jgi:Tannase and feruloyl esterase
MGGCEQTETFLRLFLITGVHHGRGGPGLTEFDALNALEKWVERGPPPKLIPAIGTTAPLNAADLSSLTPMLARYSGKRDPKEAESFVPCDSSRH